jgi:selenide,water dikinase
MLARGIAPGGSRKNAEEHARFTEFDAGVEPQYRMLFSDAQTSGGLLIAVPPDGLPVLLDALGGLDALAAVIGSVEAGRGIAIVP